MATTLRGMKKGRGGKLSSTDKGYVYTESQEYVVISDVKNETIFNVLSTAGLPRIGFTSTAFANAVCRDLTPKQDTKSPYVWYVTADYTTEPLNQDTDGDDEDNPNPTAWIPIYRGGIEITEDAMSEDFSTTPKKYLNSAGKAFPDPLVRRRPAIVYQFQQFIASSVTDYQIGEYNDTINLTAFRGFPADTLKCTIGEFERGYFYGMDCTKVPVKLAYKRDGWLDKKLDAGYEARPAAGDKPVSTAGGRLALLAADGTEQAEGLPPRYITFVPHPRVEFSTFLR